MFEAALDEPTPARQWLDHPPTVTAVVVSHNGARWLPHALDALLTQEHPPDAVTAVDVASTDTSLDLLATRLPHSHLVRAPSGTAFGVAVRLALGEAPRTDWLWLLHDDCAPAPDALACLLDEATAADDVAVVGPKIREWPSLRRLLEVGVTLTGTGQRDTGLETGEPDQGQHDRPRDVLAVSSAGMLVRRETWDALEGFDAALPMFCDDIDFGWRASRAGQRVRVAPSAVLFHVEAGANELRADPLVGSVRRAQRQSCPLHPAQQRQSGRAPLAVVPAVRRDAVASVDPPRRQGAARGRRRGRRRSWPSTAGRSRCAPPASGGHGPPPNLPPACAACLPHAFQPYQHGIDSLAELVVAVLRPSQAESTGRRAVHAGPGHVAAVDAAPRRRLLARFPWLVVVVALLVASVVAARGLVGPGALVGGRCCRHRSRRTTGGGCTSKDPMRSASGAAPRRRRTCSCSPCLPR
ncbi:MAG: glycosyltransferase [Nocardioidaceae bacterium]